LVEEKKRRN